MQDMNGRKICIVGFSALSREWALQQPLDVEIWAENECHLFLERYSRWYQLHPRTWKEERRQPPFDRNCFGRSRQHVWFLQHCGVPVYMREAYEDIPTAMRYPLEEVVAEFGYYLTSTPAMMLAHALYEHIQGDTIAAITTAGIELAIGTEYFLQRPCFEYYLGIAKGLGIRYIPPPQGCSLLNGPLYAHDDPHPMDGVAPSPVQGTEGMEPLYMAPQSIRSVL